MAGQNRHQRHANRGNIAVPAHLRHKSSPRLQHAVDLGDHRVLIANPMQCSIREHGVKCLVRVRQLLGVAQVSHNASFPRRTHHLQRSIHTQHVRAGRRDPLRQLPVTATEVKNLLSRLGRQPLQHAARKLVNKGSVQCIRLCIPGLGHSVVPLPSVWLRRGP